jgi:hypothetical protein
MIFYDKNLSQTFENFGSNIMNLPLIKKINFEKAMD